MAILALILPIYGGSFYDFGERFQPKHNQHIVMRSAAPKQDRITAHIGLNTPSLMAALSLEQRRVTYEQSVRPMFSIVYRQLVPVTKQ